MATVPEPRISLAGSSALLLDGAEGTFQPLVQQRIWATAESARDVEGVRETVPGMNNLLVVFDPLVADAGSVGDSLRAIWAAADSPRQPGRTHVFPVSYGGARGEDLAEWARHCSMPIGEAVSLHAAGEYVVAAVGAMPGFPYLSGLDPRLARPRRPSPRFKVVEGSVVIGGTQAGIMPMTAPSGWHVIGHTDVALFDPSAEEPVLLQPGDMIRFTIANVEQ